MNQDTQSPTPRKRNRRRLRPVCVREGCERLVRQPDRSACCYLCQVVNAELIRAQRICEATQDIEHWLAVVAFNDALTAYYSSDSRVYSAAREVGISDEQWRVIKHGSDR